MANNTVTSPKGFLASAVRCGIKKSGNLDLGMIVCTTGAKAAAVFTTNKIVAAPVAVSKAHIRNRVIHGVVVNSGNANACTGKKGFNDTIAMCRQTAKQINVDPHQILAASTGIIGKPLPISKIEAGIKKAAGKLSKSAAAGLDFAKAIMTTDTRPKQAVRRIKISGKDITIAGTVKGAGMIAPNMATTLCFITTNVVIGKLFLRLALKEAIGKSLNKLTVDGHQSTNDTAIVLSSYSGGNKCIDNPGKNYLKFTSALTDLCEDLARQMVAGAEGAAAADPAALDAEIRAMLAAGASSREIAAALARPGLARREVYARAVALRGKA